MNLIFILFIMIVIMNKVKQSQNEEEITEVFTNSTKNSGYDKDLAEKKYRQRMLKEELLQKKREKEKQQQLQAQEERRRRQEEEERRRQQQDEKKRRERQLAEEKRRQKEARHKDTSLEIPKDIQKKVSEQEMRETFCVEHYLDPLTAPFYPGNEKKEKDSFCVDDYLFPTLAPYYPNVEEQVMELAAK